MRCLAPFGVALALVGCGEDNGLLLPYASELVAFSPGPGAGFGQDALPDVVLGPPVGGGATTGSIDVLSLGVGGSVILGFATPILDGPGPDFVVFENAFFVGGNPDRVFAELGRVSVSSDGETWRPYPCESDAAIENRTTCAGWRPTLRYEPAAVLPVDIALTGGDPFDLADVGLAEASFVRIDDLATEGEAPTAGFDLDAVGIVHR